MTPNYHLSYAGETGFSEVYADQKTGEVYSILTGMKYSKRLSEYQKDNNWIVVPISNINNDRAQLKALGESMKINSDGGPSDYYDFQPDWVTWNDLADYKSKAQWKEHSFHLGNIGKAIFRWGEKNGTTKTYDAKKIIYSALRILLMLEGKKSVKEYLETLLKDEQFK